MAQSYMCGIDVEKNPKLATYWYKKAAAQGNLSAIQALRDLECYG